MIKLTFEEFEKKLNKTIGLNFIDVTIDPKETRQFVDESMNFVIYFHIKNNINYTHYNIADLRRAKRLIQDCSGSSYYNHADWTYKKKPYFNINSKYFFFKSKKEVDLFIDDIKKSFFTIYLEKS